MVLCRIDRSRRLIFRERTVLCRVYGCRCFMFRERSGGILGFFFTSLVSRGKRLRDEAASGSFPALIGIKEALFRGKRSWLGRLWLGIRIRHVCACGETFILRPGLRALGIDLGADILRSYAYNTGISRFGSLGFSHKKSSQEGEKVPLFGSCGLMRGKGFRRKFEKLGIGNGAHALQALGKPGLWLPILVACGRSVQRPVTISHRKAHIAVLRLCNMQLVGFRSLFLRFFGFRKGQCQKTIFVVHRAQATPLT